MIHISLILCFLAVYLHDSFAAALGAPPLPPLSAALTSLAPFAGLILFTHLSIQRLGRIVDQTGSWAAVRRAETLVRRNRTLAVIIHLLNVSLVGWVPAVRSVTSDLILIDELIILAPVLITWSMGWWSIEPIERRVREASLVRDLDSGKPLYPIVTRWQFVLSNIRYHVLLIFVPMALLLAWAETVERFAPRFLRSIKDPHTGRMVLDPALEPVALAIQLCGVAILFALMPLGLRYVWDTIPMGPGRLRDSLMALCTRCRVRVGNLLVWRTHGLMLNGAVVGLFWPLRYILLTDALLDSLTPAQVEAVAAHEVGHVRRRHIIWLAVTMLTAITGVSMLLAFLQGALSFVMPALAPSAITEAALAFLSLALSLCIMGYVSRRFEWQADAFAVAAISRRAAPDGSLVPSPSITPDAVASMQGALSTVAHSSGLPIRKFTWRHGSIWVRQKRLARLVNAPISRLPIDRDVRWLKLAITLATLAIILAGLSLYGLGALLAHLAPPAP